MQPKERLPEVLAAADIHVVPLRRGLARASVPSKLYSILAAGRPVVASVDPGTEVAAGARAGRRRPGRAARRRRGVHEGGRSGWSHDPDEAAAMGAAGRRFVESWASPAAVAAPYEALFDGAAAATARHG